MLMNPSTEEQMNTTITPGESVLCKRGKPYATVTRVNGSGFWIAKLSTGKEQRISYRKVEATRAALKAGKALKFQSNGPDGISYTIAVEAGVLHCLREIAELHHDTKTITHK
jgi:hypothetical protein